jgi:murein DD-endopeptidase MepM/ murein hydrolase activator NlpD
LKRIKKVRIQSYSPETNYFKNQIIESPNFASYATPIYLPILGEWRVSQGHNGKITHQSDWKHAWDFDIINENKQTFNGKGTELKDFLCYNMPVVAPADGYVVKIENGHKDNKIGSVNLKHNWGNSIIIKHGDFLYSNLSHLKKNSFKVSEGDFIKKGELIAKCGNSGRSPEPHLHFQLQAMSQIGSSTINYPIQLFDTIINNKVTTNYKNIPKESSIVKNTIINNTIKKAFTFMTGDSIKIMLGQKEQFWKVNVNTQNQHYIYCEESRSYTYFKISDSAIHFYDFVGNKKSLLHSFYQAALHIPFYQLPNHPIYNSIPVDSFCPGWVKIIQEILAPFGTFTKANQTIESKIDNKNGKTIFEAKYKCYLINKPIKETTLNIVIEKDNIESFSFIVNNKKIIACVN